jgi:hypothetical protein
MKYEIRNTEYKRVQFFIFTLKLKPKKVQIQVQKSLNF